MIRIFTDTSANLPAELIIKHSVKIIPLTFTVGGVESVQEETEDFDGKAFYNAMRSGTPVKTSMINTAAFLNAFEPELKCGNDIIYIAMSGGISGTAQAARTAAAELEGEYPERSIAVIDTLAASLGEGLLVLEAAEMNEGGVSFKDIVGCISEKRKNMCQFFTVEDLKYLKNGGRISGATAVVGTILNIKPILKGDDAGRIISCGKVRGKRAALMTLAENFDKLAKDKKETLGIAHADSEDDAAFLLSELKKRGFKGKCITVCYEPVTGAHVGPGTVALFFGGIHK